MPRSNNSTQKREPLPPATRQDRSEATRGQWELRWLGRDAYNAAWDLIDDTPEFYTMYRNAKTARSRRLWLESLSRVAQVQDAHWQAMALELLRASARAFLADPAAGRAMVQGALVSAEAFAA